mgnify:CR=1 FL=1
MRKRISRGIFWLLSVAMMLAGIILSVMSLCLNKQLLLQSLFVLATGILLNPIILDKLVKSIGVKTMDYSQSLEFSIIFLGALLAFGITAIIYLITSSQTADETASVQNFESILKITVYITYIAVLFINQNADKKVKYIIFGIVYLFCVLLSFASQSINCIIVKFLNLFSDSDLDLEALELFVNNVLFPIREAILTYIIFDTIIGRKGKEKDNMRNIDNDNDENMNCDGKQYGNIPNEKTFEIELTDNGSAKNVNYTIRIERQH